MTERTIDIRSHDISNSCGLNFWYTGYKEGVFVNKLLAFMLLGFANDLIAKTLVKNNYTAQNLMMDDYKSIDTASVVDNGGGVRVINTNYEVLYSAGINTLLKDKLTTAEFTDFLVMSKRMGIPYSYSIEYNAKEHFWLVVTFPTSIRIDFAIVYKCKEFTNRRNGLRAGNR